MQLGSIKYKDTKFLTATIRLFADSGAGDKGMPYYTVIYGAEGKRHVVPRPRTAPIPKKILLPRLFRTLPSLAMIAHRAFGLSLAPERREVRGRPASADSR